MQNLCRVSLSNSPPISPLYIVGGKMPPPRRLCGGRGGIRTPGTLAGTPVFKTGAINPSATLPHLDDKSPAQPRRHSLAVPQARTRACPPPIIVSLTEGCLDGIGR